MDSRNCLKWAEEERKKGEFLLALKILSEGYDELKDEALRARYDEILQEVPFLRSREDYHAYYEEGRPFFRKPLKFIDWWLRARLGKKAKKLLESVPRDQTRYLPLEEKIRENNFKSVLDVGCHEGTFSICLAGRNPEISVEGVDISPSNIRVARTVNRFPNAAFREGLAEELHETFPADSFDFVMLGEILEHVPDVDAVLDSVMRVVRTGGMVMVTVPREKPAHESHNHQHVRFFTPDLIKKTFGHFKGYELDKVFPVGQREDIEYWYLITFRK